MEVVLVSAKFQGHQYRGQNQQFFGQEVSMIQIISMHLVLPNSTLGLKVYDLYLFVHLDTLSLDTRYCILIPKTDHQTFVLFNITTLLER